MIDPSHAFIAYGTVTEVYSSNGRRYGYIANSDRPRRKIFFHENERGVYAQGDYQMPVIITLPDRFSGPTIPQKNPAVGDLVAYYLGISDRGPFARSWCTIPPSKKSSFPAAHKVAAAKG
ncbi:MAG: hypothetical protein E4H47_00680 [Parcubacteria group bacterium]|nr:MAG: hypothetical protein E4H47_00680 [Parcubacteria group bacterium]